MHFLSLFLSLFFFLSCNSQDKKETMTLQEYQYNNDKRIVYGLDVTIPGPYEAYVNDILVEKNNETSMHNTLININQAVLKSGTYNFRIKVYPTVGEEKGIEPQTLSFLKVGLAKYEKISVVKEHYLTPTNIYKVTLLRRLTNRSPFMKLLENLKQKYLMRLRAGVKARI